MKMSLINYSFCVFFILITLTISIFIILIFSSILRNPRIKMDKNHLNSKLSSIDSDLISGYLMSNKHPNVSNKFIEFLHKNRLISRLRRSESDLSKYLLLKKDYKNIYNVQFNGKKNSLVPNIDLLCDLPVNFIISPIKSNSYSVLNTNELKDILGINQNTNDEVNCAIVSNSGSLIGSKLGKEIDSHEIVMRFNNAPILTYEEDVGIKTSIRLINSQLLLNHNFNLSSSHLYRNILKFVWDSSDYRSDFKHWFNKSNDFFESYKQTVQLFPNEMFAILEPRLIWDSWDLLQMSTTTTIPKNPPTSGFLGIIILLKVCSKLDIYEYIPSIRITEKCHYYDNNIDRGCTFGNWHPLSTEKLFIISINEGKEIASKGKVSLKGCPHH